MLHKLRRAMVAPERTLLQGPVEVDESFVGGPEAGRDGRFLGDKELVVVAVEVRGAGSGRVRMQVIEDASSNNLTGFVTANVTPGATVHTDGWTCGVQEIRSSTSAFLTDSSSSRPSTNAPAARPATWACAAARIAT